MGYFLKTLLFVLIMTVMISIGAASLDNDSHGIPSYAIFTYTNNFQVNRGDYISVNIYIWGVGDVDAHKIDVSMSPAVVSKGGVEISWFTNDTLYAQFSTNDSTFEIPEDFFTSKKELANWLINVGELPSTPDEMYHSPLTFDFKVNENVPPGDYEIATILFYKNGSQWYQSEKTMTIHVNNWQEEHYLLYKGLVLPLVGAIAIAIASFIWHFVAKSVKGTKERENMVKKDEQEMAGLK